MAEETPSTKTEALEEPTLLEETQAAIKELKAANAIKKELLEREEKLKAQEMLGGKSAAGEPTPEPKEETPAEYVKRVMRGEVEWQK